MNKPENDGTYYRVWSDGTTQEANQEPYSWMSDDFTVVTATSPEEAAARVFAPAPAPAPDTRAEDALWHEYAGKALRGLLSDSSRYGAMADYARDAADAADAMLAEARKRGRV